MLYGGKSSELSDGTGDGARFREEVDEPVGRAGVGNIRDESLRLKWYMPIDMSTLVAISISGEEDCERRQYFL